MSIAASSANAPDQLNQWLDRLERIDPNRIELGLDRVHAVWKRLVHSGFKPARVITVAGTNGKGSSTAMLASILQAGGYRVGLYTSPHLVRFTERIRILGAEIGASSLVAAFEQVERAAGETPLTYFEWATLAAFVAFAQAKLDVWVLEVGLGGRLDAVNILDADLALITPIGLDHVALLGNDRATIALEKAGILRPGKPAVYADPDPVPAMIEYASARGVPLQVAGQDYDWSPDAAGMVIRLSADEVVNVPEIGLPGMHQCANAAGVVALLRHSGEFSDVGDSAIRQGLRDVRVQGRCERFLVQGREVILDVAHNPDGVAVLRQCLDRMAPARHLAVFSALADKDAQAMLSCMVSLIDGWHVGRIDSPRGRSPEEIADLITAAGGRNVHHETGLPDAYNAALAQSIPGDRIVVFGSFLVVGALRDLILQEGGRIG